MLVNVEWNDESSFEGRSAVVVAHSRYRNETLARAKELPVPRNFTHFFVDEFDVRNERG